jgi:predicted peroxiredoxin
MKTLVVKVMAGSDDAERAAQAFTVAATALASGFNVSLWLTSEASYFALPGRCEEFVLPHSAPLAELRDALLASGSITLCSQCAVRRNITESDLLPGVVIKGAASFVQEIMQSGTQALIY